MVIQPSKELNSEKSTNLLKNGNNIDENGKKKHERVKKVILNVLKNHDLDVRDLTITSDGKYLISCSEGWQNESPKVNVWRMENILEGGVEPDAILEIEGETNKENLISNWLLCVDALITKINNVEKWIVCAGGINGNIYMWSGGIDETTKQWIFKDTSFKIFSEKSENNNEFSNAIFTIKILKSIEKNNKFHIYFVSNNIRTIYKEKTGDNSLKELTVTLDKSGTILDKSLIRLLGTKQDEWILTIDIYAEDQERGRRRFLVSGTKNGTIKKWDLEAETSVEPITIGSHKDSVSCVKIFKKGTRVASGCLDSSIRIWNIENATNSILENEFMGHEDEVVSLAIEKNDNILISASKDNTIKIWEINLGIWIRNIDVDYYCNEYDKKRAKEDGKEKKSIERGLDFLRDILISPNNRHIIATKKNRIILLRNFGVIWHFAQQLKFIRTADKDLYQKIYGDNLRQISKNSDEDIRSLENLFAILKKRLKKATQIKLAHKINLEKEKTFEYNPRDLDTFFIPAFVRFEMEQENQISTIASKHQKEYTAAVRTKYDAYWYSVKNLFFKLPDLPWKFRFFITTNGDENIKDAKFVEITDPKHLDDSAYIVLKDRGQSQVRFLMVLDNIPTSFIPLINNITIDIEDDRGDKDSLVFSDWTFSYDFINILTNPRESEESKPLNQLYPIFYSYCTFKLDEGYSTEDYANIFIRKISLEFNQNLNPLEKTEENLENIKIFEALRNNFLYPITPKIQVQIGKGIISSAGKVIDDYLSRLILLEFIFTLMDVLIIVLFPDALDTLLGMVFFGTGIIGMIIIIVTFILMLKK